MFHMNKLMRTCVYRSAADSCLDLITFNIQQYRNCWAGITMIPFNRVHAPVPLQYYISLASRLNSTNHTLK